MALILTIFLFVLFNELISWIGKSVLEDFAYVTYQRIFSAPLVSQQRQLKADILKTKSELLATSAQQEFAKWAKLRRKVDKGLADLEKLNSELVSTKTAFSLKFNSVLVALTWGGRFIIMLWYRSAAVFYLPSGWMGPLDWWLSLPGAPKGAVSVAVWQMVCQRVIKAGERVVKDFARPSLGEPVAVPVGVGADGSGDDDKKAQ